LTTDQPQSNEIFEVLEMEVVEKLRGGRFGSDTKAILCGVDEVTLVRTGTHKDSEAAVSRQRSIAVDSQMQPAFRGLGPDTHLTHSGIIAHFIRCVQKFWRTELRRNVRLNVRLFVVGKTLFCNHYLGNDQYRMSGKMSG
jgi:hypothetical protein